MGTVRDKETEKAIRNFVRVVRRSRKDARFLLFGSRARGDWLLTSDVDLIIISDGFTGPLKERTSDILKLWKGSVDLEPICYTTKEFSRLTREPGTIQQAAKEGVEV